MKGTSARNNSVIIRCEILLQLFSCENFSGPSRNGPRGSNADRSIRKTKGLYEKDEAETSIQT